MYTHLQVGRYNIRPETYIIALMHTVEEAWRRAIVDTHLPVSGPQANIPKIDTHNLNAVLNKTAYVTIQDQSADRVDDEYGKKKETFRSLYGAASRVVFTSLIITFNIFS